MAENCGEATAGSTHKETVVRRLAIGRRISEYISKSHNARVRYSAYDAFIKLIESNRTDFEAVWAHRTSSPRKKREGEEFVSSLRAHEFQQSEKKNRALKLLWLLDQTDSQK